MSAASVRHPGEFRWETRLLAVVTLALTAFGVANCYSTGAYKQLWFSEATQQLTGAIVGGVIFLIAARTDYQLWRRLARPLFYATLAGLIILAVVALIWGGKLAPGPISAFVPVMNGSRRWLKFGPLTLQLSEIGRFTLMAFVATRAVELGSKIWDFRQGYLPLLTPVALTAVLVFLEPNLTMAMLLGTAGVMIMFIAGARIPHLLLTGAVGAAGAVLALSTGFRSARVESFGGAMTECAADGQVCEALIGFGSGGINGLGFGEGTQKLGHLSYAYSDMILSVVAEEFGLVGVGVTMLLFALFCWMGFRIAKTARDPFGTYLAAGLTAMVGVAAFLHAAVVLRMMPATGLTLPFISAGRVSLIMYLFTAGVVVSIGRNRGRPARGR